MSAERQFANVGCWPLMLFGAICLCTVAGAVVLLSVLRDMVCR